MKQENLILQKYSALRGFTQDAVDRALKEICEETGFVPVQETLRRYIFDPSKTWRVHFRGWWGGPPVSLCIENMPHETDEEDIRQAFRKQARALGVRSVRPPRTFLHHPFDEARGYAWTLCEEMSDRLLFVPDRESAGLASQSFADFYRALRRSVKMPFWPCEHADASSFSQTQLEEWKKLSLERHPDHAARVMPIVDRLAGPYLAARKHRTLKFMHAHLTGTDVRIGPAGEYIVYANLFWKWRQPGYDVTFPMWGQWLALPDDKRTPETVRSITETWIEMIRGELHDLVDAEDVLFMVMNRLIGALLLDVQAQRVNRSEPAVIALEAALITEAKRILAI